MRLGNIPLFLSLLALSLFVACSDDDSNPVQNIVNEPDLNGRYMASCQGIEIAGQGVSMQTTYRFEANGGFSRYQDLFSNPDCQGNGRLGTLEISGNYSVDNDGAPQSEGGAITLNVTKAMVTVDSDTAAQTLSGLSLCGRDNYQVGENEITEGTDELFCPVQAVPDTRYGVYREDDGRLYLNSDGYGGMGQSAEDRPDDLETETVYAKQ